MKYYAKDTFTQISETSGTIQNASRIYNVEISNQAVVDSGILLFPLNKFSFSDTTLYIRCADKGGWAEIRVVPFLVDFGTASSGGSSSVDSTDADVDAMIADALNGDIVTDPDADATIDEMLDNTDHIDTGDGFSDFVDELFP